MKRRISWTPYILCAIAAPLTFIAGWRLSSLLHSATQLGEVGLPVPILSSGPSSGWHLNVAMYFPLQQSKHTPALYAAWLSQFMHAVRRTRTILYTPLATAQALAQASPRTVQIVTSQNISAASWSRGHVMAFTDWQDIFELPCVSNLPEVYAKQQFLDPEARIHTPQLYAIWHAKLWLAVHGSNIFADPPSTVLYTDAGAFREGWAPAQAWPNTSHVHHLVQAEQARHRLVVFAVTPPVQECFTQHQPSCDRADFIEGGAYLGSPAAFLRAWVHFRELHNALIRHRAFVGKDQVMLNALVYSRPDVLAMVPAFALQGCGNVWFAYQQLLAHADDRHSGCACSSGVVGQHPWYCPSNAG